MLLPLLPTLLTTLVWVLRYEWVGVSAADFVLITLVTALNGIAVVVGVSTLSMPAEAACSSWAMRALQAVMLLVVATYNAETVVLLDQAWSSQVGWLMQLYVLCLCLLLLPLLA